MLSKANYLQNKSPWQEENGSADAEKKFRIKLNNSRGY